MEGVKGPRRLGVLLVVALVLAGAVVAFLLLRGGGAEPANTGVATYGPSATATPCVEAKPPYGSAPGGFKYEKADAQTREKTVKALGLTNPDVDMRLARRGGITLGSLVGVPSEDPASYVSTVIGRARASGAGVTSGQGFTVITLSNGAGIAIGTKGCRAVMITSQDPNGMTYLASAVFGD